MDWTQTYTIIGVLVGLFTIFTGFFVWMVNRIDSDVKSIGSRLDGHAQRIDQLYKMFVDLLKEMK